MNILVGCEETGIVRDAFTRHGHFAVSCDLVESRTDGPHLQMDIMQAINWFRWDIIILHPECRAMALCGNKTYGQDCPKHHERKSAIRWSVKLWNKAVKNALMGVAMENPSSVLFQYLDDADVQYIQPWQFGHPEQKRTGLALNRLPRLSETRNVHAEMMQLPRCKRERIFYMPPGKTRSRDRSRTFPNIADAMAEQWGKLWKMPWEEQ